jgi:hypothetical protein
MMVIAMIHDPVGYCICFVLRLLHLESFNNAVWRKTALLEYVKNEQKLG